MWPLSFCRLGLVAGHGGEHDAGHRHVYRVPRILLRRTWQPPSPARATSTSQGFLTGSGAVPRPGHRTRSPRPLVPQPSPGSRRPRCSRPAVRAGFNPATPAAGQVCDERERHNADARDTIASPWRQNVAALHPEQRRGRRRRDGGCPGGGARGMRYPAGAGRSGRTSWASTCRAHGGLPASWDSRSGHRRRRGVGDHGQRRAAC